MHNTRSVRFSLAVTQRVTWISDGTSYYMKQESYSIDMRDMEPEKSCASRILEVVHIERVRNGVMELAGVDKDGMRVAETLGPPQDARADNDTAEYTVPRNERQVSLKCLAPGSVGLTAGGASQMCIVDAGAGRTVRAADGSPVLAYLRNQAAAQLIGVMLVEPVSLRFGKIDPAILAGELK